jgi:hypothetical protein
MSNKLTKKDYINILKFYKMDIPKSMRTLKIQAEKILAEKLCKCIKKLDTEFEEKAVAICSKSIFNNKNLTRGDFKCKGKYSVKIMKNIGSTTRKKLK